jgi:5-carboxymethyl-2-hydroxymuconate isomerase
MLSSLERIRSLISRPVHTYRPSTETFADLDTQRVGAEMKLNERGVKSGRANLPPQDSLTLDAAETEILEHVGAAQKRAHDQLENHLAGFRQRLIDLDFGSRFANINRAASSGMADLEAELGKGVDQLHELRRDLKEHEDWQKDFRSKNQITRPAKITSRGGMILHCLIILIIVVIELMVNGALLSKNSELGLVGGIVEALIFAALNVGVALLFSIYWVPFLAHRSFFAKIFGLIGVVLYVGAAFSINLGLAHYREVAGAILSGGDAGEQVMHRLTTTPLVLTDFKSWLLFCVGCVFSIVAFIDGYGLRDPYPQYAKVSSRLRIARGRYQDRREELIDELQEVRRDIEDAIAGARSSLTQELAEHNSIVAHRQRMLSLFDAQQSQLEKAANALLSQYREANKATRSTPAPARFQESYKLQRANVQISQEGEWNTSELQSQIQKAQMELDELVKILLARFSAALAKYRELDVLAPDQ